LGLAVLEGENKSPVSALAQLQDRADGRTNAGKTSAQVLVPLQNLPPCPSPLLQKWSRDSYSL